VEISVLEKAVWMEVDIFFEIYDKK
jgi:hypothetical protein